HRVGLRGTHYRTDILHHQRVVLPFERADVNHHVDLPRATADGFPGLKSLRAGEGCAAWETHDGNRDGFRPSKDAGGRPNISRVERGLLNTARLLVHGANPKPPRLFRELDYLLARRIRLEQGVVDVGRNVCGCPQHLWGDARSARTHADHRGAAVDDWADVAA